MRGTALLRVVPAGCAERPAGSSAAAVTASDDLLAGASTFVPASANPGWNDIIDGTPFAIDTRITAVQFHIPGVPSRVPGGLSATPHPGPHPENGVSSSRVSGERHAHGV